MLLPKLFNTKLLVIAVVFMVAVTIKSVGALLIGGNNTIQPLGDPIDEENLV